MWSVRRTSPLFIYRHCDATPHPAAMSHRTKAGVYGKAAMPVLIGLVIRGTPCSCAYFQTPCSLPGDRPMTNLPGAGHFSAPGSQCPLEAFNLLVYGIHSGLKKLFLLQQSSLQFLAFQWGCCRRAGHEAIASAEPRAAAIAAASAHPQAHTLSARAILCGAAAGAKPPPGHLSRARGTCSIKSWHITLLFVQRAVNLIWELLTYVIFRFHYTWFLTNVNICLEF